MVTTTTTTNPAPAPARAPAPASDDPIFIPSDDHDLSGADIFALSSRHLFNRDHHKIRIRLHQAVFDKVLHDGEHDIDSGYGLVDEFHLDDVSIRNVGIKVRGNTSAANIKRQFKFKFDVENAFAWRDGAIKDIEIPGQDDRRFFGEQGFSVRASQNDPSRIREMLSGKVFRESALGKPDPQRPWRSSGGLAYRSAFATLYVTNGRKVEEGYDASNPGYRIPYKGHLYDPKGLYLVTENIDKTFIKTRFERYPGEKVKGYLVQCDKGQAHFTRPKYSRTGWKLELAKGKKAKDEDDFLKGDEKMFDLIDFLHSNPSEQDIRSRFDMDSVNAYLAGAVLCTHWDSMAANRNNDFMFYLKRDVLDDQMKPVLDENGVEKEEKRWYIITWDLDNTLWDKYGDSSDVRNPYRNWFSNYIYNPARKEDRKTVLLNQIYSDCNKQIRKAYDDLLRKLLEGYYSESTYEKKVDSLSSQVKSAIEETRREVAQADWQQSWGEYHNPKDFEDIKHHADIRRKKIYSQLD